MTGQHPYIYIKYGTGPSLDIASSCWKVGRGYLNRVREAPATFYARPSSCFGNSDGEARPELGVLTSKR
jgi:hypothetical protein